jgi:hypothetical protein
LEPLRKSFQVKGLRRSVGRQAKEPSSGDWAKENQPLPNFLEKKRIMKTEARPEPFPVGPSIIKAITMLNHYWGNIFNRH